MFLPRTFRGGGYEVTINADRSIRVMDGDWLSKYSMAIYGDFDHIDKFWKKNGSLYETIKDKNLITAGDILYHPDPLPGEPKHESLLPPIEVHAGSEPPLQAAYVAEFFQWIKHVFVPTEWTVAGNGGFDFNLFFCGAGYATIGMQDVEPRLGPEQPPVRWYHAISGGLVLGWPEEIFVGGSVSTVQFPSAGCVLKPPWRSTRLTYDDFRGGIVVVSAGFNLVCFVGGGSVTAIIFGIVTPAYVLATLDRFFRYGDRSPLDNLLFQAPGSGVVLLAGVSLGIPGAGVTGRVGYMRDLPTGWRQ